MHKRKNLVNSITVLGLFFILLCSVMLPGISVKATVNASGFDKGVSWKPVVPMKKVTFVNFDENTYLDDYAYLAAVPTSVFNDGNRLFSNPLLFYQDEYPVKEDKERSLNARQGLDYFMEDWMSYCNGKLDQMTLINVPQSKLDSSWKARNYTMIENDNPYDIASELALSEWSYSDDAVIAVIEETYERPNKITKGELQGVLPVYDIGYEHFEVELPDVGTGATWKSFDITDEHYKYIVAELSWSSVRDLDLQLYDTQLGMVDSKAEDFKYHNNHGLREIAGSFIRNYGKWQLSITAAPKKGSILDEQQEQNDLFSGLSLKELVQTLQNNEGDIDIRLYPGTSIKVPKTPFGCRNVDFMLRWDNPDIRLAFTVIDPAGTEICSSIQKEEIVSGEAENEKGESSIHIELLGETRDGENYSIHVFSLDEVSRPVDLILEYSWQQNFSRAEGDGFASASNGAVLASKLNSPLLYTSPANLPKVTKNALYKLGVKNIRLINIGDHLHEEVKEELKEIATVAEHDVLEDVYSVIKENTASKDDIVFTTIDPWTYWHIKELKPAGEYPGALFIGPAAFIAAHHNTPVVIVDLHPRLSQAATYHTHFWGSPYYKQHVTVPSSGSMMLSSKQVYDFLEDYNLGKLEVGGPAKQKQESIITVAGQYDIGISWDRSFTGAALTGRFMFSPVDTTYWISRNVFYPALIFVNPATQGEIALINGSSSKIQKLGGRLLEPKGVNLVITKPSQEEKFTYPVLQTYVGYQYKFNEKASKHWGWQYTRADGITSYVTPSPDPIDEGVVPSKSGAYYPDQSETEVIPFYCKRAGYDSVFSTNFESVVENLNRGVMIWVEVCHGGHIDGGCIGLWDSDSPYIYEENPWRGYEPPLIYPGNLRELARWAIYYVASGQQSSKLTEGLIPFHLLSYIGSTENPDVLLINPQLRLINKFLRKLKSPIDFWGAMGVMIYRDRIKHPLEALSKGLPLINLYNGDGKVVISPTSGSIHVQDWKNGIDFDDALDNLHSCSIYTCSCLPAGTYLHLTWLRHGTAFQVMDPWTTTDWAAEWTQQMMKQFAMGDTVGEAFERGLRGCAPEYTVDHWWWDNWENVELFGDPDLRVFVPGTDYSDENYWQQEDTKPLRYDAEFSVNGHMPYGATSYPHEITPMLWMQYIWIIVAVALLATIAIIIFVFFKRQKR